MSVAITREAIRLLDGTYSVRQHDGLGWVTVATGLEASEAFMLKAAPRLLAAAKLVAHRSPFSSKEIDELHEAVAEAEGRDLPPSTWPDGWV
jgi:hypothetical protein